MADVEVTAAIASGPGELVGSKQRNTDADGRATFTDLAISGPAGTRTLVFTTTDHGQVTSNEIDIAAPASPNNIAPVAEFTLQCTQLTCTFNSSGSSDPDGSIVSRNWDFGDNATSDEANPSHTFGGAGSYNVTLTVMDNDGAAHSVTHEAQPGAPTASNRPPVADYRWDCVDLVCRFTDASTDEDGSVVGWRWDFGDGGSSTDKNPTHTFEAGTYTVALTATDNGGATDDASNSLTVRAPAQAATTTTITSDEPDPTVDGKVIRVSVTVISEAGTPTGDIIITDPQGGSCTARAPSGTCTFTGVGVGKHTLTATYQGNASFARSSDTEEHTVKEAPQSDNDRPKADMTVVCDDPTLTCVFSDKSSDSDGRIVRWFWEFGDGATFDGKVPPPHQYASKTEYFSYLTVTDDAGATDSRTYMIKLDD
jgi:PKD repeat protein